MDPTIFVAITYSFIFGVMFGDVGQGLLLFIGGAILYFTKKTPLPESSLPESFPPSSDLCSEVCLDLKTS